MWKEDKISVEESILGEFSISISFSCDDYFSGWISGVYSPASNHRRDVFWQELEDLAGLSSDFWCLVGDFNVVRWTSEKSKGGRVTRNMRIFNAFIDRSELFDVPLKNGIFTWSDLREEPTATKIDRFLVSPSWFSCFKEVSLQKLSRPTSYHFPLLLSLGSQAWGPSPFRFENIWLDHPNFLNQVRDWWSE